VRQENSLTSQQPYRSASLRIIPMLFLDQGAAATTIEEICEHADVANRTFFNHFPTRQAMIQALADRRLSNQHEVMFGRTAIRFRRGSSASSMTSPHR
jgi:AcrR family transcriptional regulator